MNMRKVFKQMLATVAVGAMSMAMVMPVFAEDMNQTEAWISKTYHTEVAKAETFSFTATQKKRRWISFNRCFTCYARDFFY